jgi:DNA-directed RNA polymerase specialized sigma24 family protein
MASAPKGRRSAPARRVLEAIDELEPRERHVLALLLVEKLTVLEAAGALRMTMREVGEVYATALQRLARGTGLRSMRKAA